MHITYLGPPGTHSHEAAERFREQFLSQATLVPCGGLLDALHDVLDLPEATDQFACVPMENSIQGAVTQVWDALTAHLGSHADVDACPTHGILVAMTQPIRQYVIHHEATVFADVRRVYSHPQALAQCAHHIQSLFPKATPTAVSSTADAVRIVSEERDGTSVAIGSPRAAQAYGLSCYSQAIEDHAGNVTRFALVGSTGRRHGLEFAKGQPTERVVSLCLRGVAHQPGGLVGALSPFAQAGLNLSRVESRPVGDELGNYVFYVDISMPPDDKEAEVTIATVTQQLRVHGTRVITLGTYLVYDGTHS